VSRLLERVLDSRSLRVVFQPVIAVQPSGAELEYLEALVRGPLGSTLQQPKALFAYARKHCAEWLMDRSAILAILREARRLPESARLGVNVHVSTVAGDPEFPSFLCEAAQELWIDPRRLVVELVEEGPVWDPAALRESVECLRAVGLRIAIDDLGAGRSNLNLVPDCRPDYMKLDGYLVQGCERSAERRAVVEMVRRLGQALGSRVVAEGVETAATLRALRDAGVEHVQGFLFGQPQPAVLYQEPLRLDASFLAVAS
jgi:EAL domain-containing protein (putative c-di-GMP-specific phosphodiesterase class I)